MNLMTERLIHHNDTLTVCSCVQCEGLTEAVARRGRPVIFNTGESLQLTNTALTNTLKESGTGNLMDGPGRWMDNASSNRYGGRYNPNVFS
jgi:hypothetical protein